MSAVRADPSPASAGAERRGGGAALRLILSGALPPVLNMGLDEALLLAAGGPPTLRLYAWPPPGLSLGYFQKSAPFAAVPGPHVLVRRLTGGGAIYHDDEITFALVLDQAAFPVAVDASYRVVHDAIARALRSAAGMPVHATGCAG